MRKKCLCWEKIMFWGLFLNFKKMVIFYHFGKMTRVDPGYSQTSCFNIPLESPLYKLQNAHKISNIWRPLEICDYVNSTER